MKRKCKICRRPSSLDGSGMCRLCSDNLAICYTQSKYLGLNERQRFAKVKKETLAIITAWKHMDPPFLRLHTLTTREMEL